jgi:hypothetical protein
MLTNKNLIYYSCLYIIFTVGCSAVINKITHHIQEHSETQITQADIFTLALIVFSKVIETFWACYLRTCTIGTSMLNNKELKQGCVKEKTSEDFVKRNGENMKYFYHNTIKT